MRARTEVVVAPGGQLERLRAEPPLTVRRVHAERCDVCALCLVGTAAGPLAGDDLGFDLTVRAGAHASLTAAGASIAQGSPARPGSGSGSDAGGSGSDAGGSGSDAGGTSRLAMDITVEAGATLVADPGALIVCAGARVDVSVRIDLAATASVRWRELVVLGRTGARAGDATVRWDVVRDSEPVLRSYVDLTDPALAAWPGLIARRRVLATAFIAGPEIDAALTIATPTAVAQPLDEHAVLITVLADDAATALAQLDELSARAAIRAPSPVG